MKLTGRVLTEAGIIIAGAVVAAWAIGQVPELRAWMARQWQGAKG